MSTADDVKEIFANMPDRFIPEKAGNIETVVQIELSGEGGGDWAIKVADRQLFVTKGQVNAPKMILKMEAADYVALLHNKVNPMNLFMAGKIKVEGDITLAMKFQNMFKR